MPSTDRMQGGPHRALAFGVGLALCLLFVSLSEASGGFRIAFVPPFTSSSAGESRLWLGAAFLLTPGACLLGFGCGPWLAAKMMALVDLLRAAPRREIALALGLIYTAYVVLGRLGGAWILCDFPITDEEYANQFGGRILASGHVMIPLQGAAEAIPRLFLFSRDHRVGSMDWVGAQVAWAIAEKTGLGSVFFALCAAVPIPALAIVCGRRLGIGWGAVAVALTATSPMFLTLSMTTHTHVVSRALFALAILAFHFAEDGTRGARKRHGFAFGLAIGLGFCCRPAEIFSLSLPLVLALVLRARERRGRDLVVAMILGGLLPLGLFCLHSRAMTGDFFLPARLSAGSSVDPMGHHTLWNRLGANVGYNTLMLAIWFLGPLGVLLTATGLTRTSLTRLLGVGVALNLAVGLIHDNHGIHAVGPIHYSECVVALVVIATHGLRTLADLAARLTLDFRILIGPVASLLVVGLVPFSIVHLASLRRQAAVQEQIYSVISQATHQPDARKVVVLAPPFFRVWHAARSLEEVGTWVQEWRRPRPDFEDDLLFLRDAEGLGERSTKDFPERKIYVMTADLSVKPLN